MLHLLCDPEEMHLPMHERSTMWVCHNGKRIATLSAVDDESENRSSSTAMWKARIHHKQFDPFAHDHELDEDDPQTHVSGSEDGVMSLVNPKEMTISDAQRWVKEHYTGGDE